jgi:hypothetical protein
MTVLLEIVNACIDGGANSGSLRVGERHLVLVAGIESEPNMRDRKLVSRPKPADFDSLTIDTNPVRRSQVADDHLSAILRHTTMVARDAQRVEPCIALWMTSDNDHGSIQVDVGPFIQGHQTCGH